MNCSETVIQLINLYHSPVFPTDTLFVAANVMEINLCQQEALLEW